MIDNLNNFVPPVADSPVVKTSTEEKKTKPLPTSPLPFSETPSEIQAHFTTKRIPIRKAIRELDQFMHAQANQIEKEFKQLAGATEDKELINAILGIEGQCYDLFTFANERTLAGVEFLSKALPRSILDRMPSVKEWEELRNIASIGSTFLTALDSGYQGLALLCKSKILEKSKKFLTQFKTNYELGVSKQGGSLAIQHRKIQKEIQEWELQLALEEQMLKEEKIHFGLNAASSIFSLLNIPITYLPRDVIFQQLHLASGISWVTSALGIITMGLKLQQTREKTATLNQWMQSYQEWQDKHLPKFKITESGAQRIQFNPPKPIILSTREHEMALFSLIKKTKNLPYVRNKLKDCGIELPSSITSKAHFETYLKANSQLIKQYTDFQHKLEALNAIIYTSKNLLEKRKAIMAKKIMLLTPRFNTTEPKIRDFKQQAFVRDMQKLLWEKLPNLCTVAEIEEQFNKWGLFHSAVAAQNQKLIQAFEQFKNAKRESGGGISPSQQNLHNELNKWMSTITMERQFDNWFREQDKNSLMEDYIDHQETIEQTTKNALKQMVQQKHNLENRFQQFKSIRSHVQFSVAAISLAISVIFAILGLLSMPFGGAGLILLILSIGSAAISMGFFGASTLQNYHYRPHASNIMTFCFQFKIIRTKLKIAIQTYSQQSKEKKLIEVAKILYRLHSKKHVEKLTSTEYQKALIDYQKAKRDFEQSQEKVNCWLQRVKKMESQLAEASWKDFAQYASLQIAKGPASFDALQAFQDAFKACDLSLLSQEMKTLLEVPLGINLETLQTQMREEPEGIKNTLQEFFALGDAGLIDFIINQKARIKKRLIKASV